MSQTSRFLLLTTIVLIGLLLILATQAFMIKTLLAAKPQPTPEPSPTVVPSVEPSPVYGPPYNPALKKTSSPSADLK